MTKPSDSKAILNSKSKLGQNNNKTHGGSVGAGHAPEGTKAVESVSVSTMNKKTKEKDTSAVKEKNKEKDKSKDKEDKNAKSGRHTFNPNAKGERSPSSFSPHGTSSKIQAGYEIDEEDELANRKQSFLAFAVLPQEASEELLEMDVLTMESKLQEAFHLSPTTELRDAAVLDHYVGATWWAKGQGLDAKQLSGFFTIVHTLMEKIRDENLPLVETFKEFRKMLVGIAAETPEGVDSGGCEFFTADQARLITGYLHSSLFQHFKLYEFMFSQQQTEEIISNELTLEVPPPATLPFPPPLDEGITEDVVQDYLAIPTPALAASSDENKPLEEVPPPPPEVKLPAEVKDLFCKLQPEDVKLVVNEVAAEVLQTLQTGVEGKIRNYEETMLKRINKMTITLPEKAEEAEK